MSCDIIKAVGDDAEVCKMVVAGDNSRTRADAGKVVDVDKASNEVVEDCDVVVLSAIVCGCKDVIETIGDTISANFGTRFAAFLWFCN